MDPTHNRRAYIILALILGLIIGQASMSYPRFSGGPLILTLADVEAAINDMVGAQFITEIHAGVEEDMLVLYDNSTGDWDIGPYCDAYRVCECDCDCDSPPGPDTCAGQCAIDICP